MSSFRDVGLEPLRLELGVAPYADRVHASAVAAVPAPLQLVTVALPATSHFKGHCLGADLEEAPLQLSPRALHFCLQLSDSALPTGGFAHSQGLEAAMQLGAVSANDPKSLQDLFTAFSKEIHKRG